MHTIINDDRKHFSHYPAVMEPKKRKENQNKTRGKQEENPSPPVGFTLYETAGEKKAAPLPAYIAHCPFFSGNGARCFSNFHLSLLKLGLSDALGLVELALP